MDERLEAVPHHDYDGQTPTYTYGVDTRKHKLQAYLTGILHGFDLGDSTREPTPRESGALTPSPRLTAREQEVAELVMIGHTNHEIAKLLFVSDATVKKHINAIFAKYQLKNRTQLAKVLLEQQHGS